ncbi:MAG: DUF4465 domain-containing protein [Tannerellaceae bacterium]|nr:DUF4465 domain-containing protein [Tannerellaceae bacterium]
MKMKKCLQFLFAALFLASCSAEYDVLNEMEQGETRAAASPDAAYYTMTFTGLQTNQGGGSPYADDPYGYNFYESYGGSFKYYVDPVSQLRFGVNQGSFYPGGLTTYDYWYGGIGVSNFNEIADTTYMNQLSVYAGNLGTNTGGGYDDNYFAVVFGYEDPTNYIYAPSVDFADGGSATFVSMKVCNTVYARSVMKYGNRFGGTGTAGPLGEGDYLRIEVRGYRGDSIEVRQYVYLADFVNKKPDGTYPGVIEGWQDVTFSSEFSEITKLEFNIQGTDTDPVYGLNTPAYFAMDNLEYIK